MESVLEHRLLPNMKIQMKRIYNITRYAILETLWRTRVWRIGVISDGSRVEKYRVSGLNTCLARVPFPQKFTRRKRDSYVQFHVRKSGKISDEGVPRVNNPLFPEGFPTTYSLTCPQFVSSWNFLELLFLSLEISLCCLLLLLFTSLNRYRSLFYSSSLSCVLFIIGTPLSSSVFF